MASIEVTQISAWAKVFMLNLFPTWTYLTPLFSDRGASLGGQRTVSEADMYASRFTPAVAQQEFCFY